MSIGRAAECGACGVEIDLRVTSDDVVVLMHDSTVDRTTNGNGRVCDFTLQQLRQLSVGAKHLGAQVPTLEEAVLHAQKHKLGVFLDLKNTHNVSDSPPSVGWLSLSFGRSVAQHTATHRWPVVYCLCGGGGGGGARTEQSTGSISG